MKLSGIALRNVKRNRKRSILSVLSTGIATFAIVFLFAYMDGMTEDMKDMAYNYNTGEVVIRSKMYDEKVFSLNRAIDNYKGLLSNLSEKYSEFLFSPRINFPSTVLDGDRSYQCFGLSVDFDLERKYLKLDDSVISGQLPESSREVLMGAGLAKELGLNIGDKFTPITATRKGASTGITFKITGLARFRNSTFTNKTFIVPLTGLPNMLKMKGAVTEILIKNIGGERLDEVVNQINSEIEKSDFSGIHAVSWKKIGLGFSMIRMANITYTIMAFFFFFLASSVIANTMLMVIFERRKEIGTITAMGMNSSEVIRLFFLEAFYLGISGAGAGIVAGALLVIPLSYIGLDFSSVAEDIDMGMSFVIYPQLNLKSTGLVFLYSVFVSSFISFFPSKSASKVDPVEALRDDY